MCSKINCALLLLPWLYGAIGKYCDGLLIMEIVMVVVVVMVLVVMVVVVKQ